MNSNPPAGPVTRGVFFAPFVLGMIGLLLPRYCKGFPLEPRTCAIACRASGGSMDSPPYSPPVAIQAETLFCCCSVMLKISKPACTVGSYFFRSDGWPRRWFLFSLDGGMRREDTTAA